MSNVEMRQVEGFPNYSIGSDGSVWGTGLSRGRVRKNPKRVKGRIGAGGYLRVILYGKDGRRYATVHTLVLEAFVGPRPEGMECRHADGNRLNVAMSNLSWGTHSENAKDQRRHGTGRTQILTEEDVEAMKAERENGKTYKEIAAPRGVHETTAHNAVNGKTWR